MDLLARLALLLHGEWRALTSRLSAVRWSFAPGGETLLWIGLPVVALASVFCYYRTSEGLQIAHANHARRAAIAGSAGDVDFGRGRGG